MRLPSGGDAIYEVLCHTADTGITTRGLSLDEVIGNAAYAMFDLMYDLGRVGAGTTIEFEVEPAEPPDLLVAVLSELLYRSEAGDVGFSAIDIRSDPARLVVTATGHPIEALRPSGPPIKAVTYHDLRCEPTNDGWFAQVIFDV